MNQKEAIEKWDRDVERLKAEIKELDNLYIFGFYFLLVLLGVLLGGLGLSLLR